MSGASGRLGITGPEAVEDSEHQALLSQWAEPGSAQTLSHFGAGSHGFGGEPPGGQDGPCLAAEHTETERSGPSDLAHRQIRLLGFPHK